MNKLIVILISLFLCSFAVAQNKYDDKVGFLKKFDNRGAHVEQTWLMSDGTGASRKLSSNYDDKGNMIYQKNENGNESNQITRSYNERGDLIMENYYNSEGEFQYKDTCIYNEKGKIVGKLVRSHGRLLNRFTWKYDFKGNMIEQNQYDVHNESGRPYITTITKYDDKGNKTEMKETSAWGSLETRRSFIYDEKGRLTEDNWYHSDGHLLEQYAFRFDKKGNVTELNYIGYSGNLKVKRNFVFDDKGNMLIDSIVGAGCAAVKYTYLYDNKNNMVEQNNYTCAGSLKSTFKYDDKGFISEQNNFNINGKPESKITSGPNVLNNNSLSSVIDERRLDANGRKVLAVKKNGKWALTDTATHSPIFEYDYMGPFSRFISKEQEEAELNGQDIVLGAVAKRNGEWIFIDNTGKKYSVNTISNLKTDMGGNGFNFKIKNFTVFNVGDQYGYYDNSGKIIDYGYDNMFPYPDGQYLNPEGVQLAKNGKKGLMNRNGKIIFPPVYDDFYQPGHDPMLYRVWNDPFLGLIDWTGKIIAPVEYQDILFGTENKFIALKKDDKWGIINDKGIIMAPFIYDSIVQFDDDNMAVVKKDGKFGLINKGKMTVPVKYESIDGIDKNVFVVSESGTYKCIDDKGKTIAIIGHNDTLSNFKYHGHSIISIGGHYSAINEKAEIINALPYDYIQNYNFPIVKNRYNKQNKNGFLVNKNNKYGVINRAGKEIIATEYDFIDPDYRGFFLVCNNNKYGIINIKGKIISPVENTYIHVTDMPGFIREQAFYTDRNQFPFRNQFHFFCRNQKFYSTSNSSIQPNIALLKKNEKAWGLSIGIVNKTCYVAGICLGVFNRPGKRTMRMINKNVPFCPYPKINGLQLGLINKPGRMNGMQIGLRNSSDYLKGISLSLFNRIIENMSGLQLGIINTNYNTATGAEVGILNFANNFNGFQFGLFNKSKDLNGVQLGLINYVSENRRPFKCLPLINFHFRKKRPPSVPNKDKSTQGLINK